MANGYSGLLWLIVVIADIYAIVRIIQSSATPLAKTLWIVLILVAPLIGFAIWYFLGPK